MPPSHVSVLMNKASGWNFVGGGVRTVVSAELLQARWLRILIFIYTFRIENDGDGKVALKCELGLELDGGLGMSKTYLLEQ